MSSVMALIPKDPGSKDNKSQCTATESRTSNWPWRSTFSQTLLKMPELVRPTLPSICPTHQSKVRGSEMLEFWFTEGGRCHEPGEMSFGGREMQESRLYTRTPWSIPTLPTSWLHPSEVHYKPPPSRAVRWLIHAGQCHQNDLSPTVKAINTSGL